MRVPIRFKVIDLAGNFNLQYVSDDDDKWYPVPIVELDNVERAELTAKSTDVGQHTPGTEDPARAEVE